MIVESIRRLRTWLEDGATGVNALLPDVPRPLGEAAPALVTVADETRDGWVARQLIDRTALAAGPVLTVGTYDQPIELPAGVEPGLGGAVIPLVLRYAALGDLSDRVVVDAWRTLRCAQRAVAGRFDGPHAAEVHEGITYYEPAGFRHLPDYVPSGDGLYVGGLLLLLRASDPWALAIDI